MQSDEQPQKAELFKLVTKGPAKPHRFGAATIVHANEACDGLERHERACTACPLVRITVIAPSWSKAPAWREYRFGEDAFLLDREPACGEMSLPMTMGRWDE